MEKSDHSFLPPLLPPPWQITHFSGIGPRDLAPGPHQNVLAYLLPHVPALLHRHLVFLWVREAILAVWGLISIVT